MGLSDGDAVDGPSLSAIDTAPQGSLRPGNLPKSAEEASPASLQRSNAICAQVVQERMMKKPRHRMQGTCIKPSVVQEPCLCFRSSSNSNEHQPMGVCRQEQNSSTRDRNEERRWSLGRKNPSRIGSGNINLRSSRLLEAFGRRWTPQ